MSKIIAIHPQDKTTEFLKAVIESFASACNIIVLEPDATWDFHYIENRIEAICESDDIILFLGHGRSNSLYGAPNGNGEKSILLTLEQAERVFANRNVVLFSCRSSELLRQIRSSIRKFVGFGEMPTDWSEINAERDIGDYRYLAHLTSESLEEFKSILVSMIVAARAALLEADNFSRMMYLILRLELNKAMLKVAAIKGMPLEERRELFKIVQMVKVGLSYKD